MPPKKKENPDLKFKSPAEFFANNKGIAGFDNPGKSLYTSVRELVENSLDAAESIGVLPQIDIKLEEIDETQFHEFAGVQKLERLDENIYKKKKKPAKGSRAEKALEEEQKREEEEAENNPDGKAKSKVNRRDKTFFYRLCVKDNGCGMAHDDIPNMLGRVLAGTKYCVRQNRGRFGLGSKMVLIWSKMSTSQPLHVRSSQSKTGPVTDCILDMEIYKNLPNILKHDKVENTDQWRGSELSVLIEGNWGAYGHRILNYMRQMAVITPYADFKFSFDRSDGKESFAVVYSRRTDHMPRPPLEINHHPSSVNLIVLKHLLGQVPKITLKRAFVTKFSSINNSLATKLVGELGVDSNTKVSSLTDDQFIQISNLFKEIQFPKPTVDCLSPAGEYNLRLGVMKEIEPDMVATASEPACVYEGHPFIVEAAVSLGGAKSPQGLTIHRFANRIPLLFEPGSDVVTIVAKNLKWATYKLNHKIDKIGIFVSIVSTKIPFKGTGKEYIGADIDEISNAVKRAIQQCCVQLRSKIMRNAALKDAANRKKTLVKYIPNVSNALFSIIQKIDDNDEKIKGIEVTCVECPKKVQDEVKEDDIVDKIRSGEVTTDTYKRKLETFVHKLDASTSIDEAQAKELQSKRIKLNLVPFDKSQQSLYQIQHPAGNILVPKWLLL